MGKFAEAVSFGVALEGARILEEIKEKPLNYNVRFAHFAATIWPQIFNFEVTEVREISGVPGGAKKQKFRDFSHLQKLFSKKIR